MVVKVGFADGPEEKDRTIAAQSLVGKRGNQALWDYELAKAVDELYQDIQADGEDYGFAITENRGHVAMVLITRDKTIYKNEMLGKSLLPSGQLPTSKIFGALFRYGPRI